MGLIETEALVLKTYSLAEADKIVVLLSQNEGLVRGVAKGAKRLKSRFGGSLEPFSIVNITFFQKEERELVSISQIELIKSNFENASHPQFLQKFSYLADLLTEFAPPHDPNERLYRMTKVCLETAAQMPENLESIVLYFELWILRLGGYLPDWNVCDECKKNLDENASGGLQINFQLHCQFCRKISESRLITPIQRQIFTAAQKLSPLSFVKFSLDKSNEVFEVSEILRRLISSILGKEAVGEKILTANLQIK